MEFKSVSKNCIKEWCITRTICFLLFAGVLAGLFFIPTEESYQIIIKTLCLIFWGMLTLLSAFCAFILPVMQYKRLKYRIDASRIEKHSGVIFLRKEFVPFVRIQHTEIFRGVFDRIFEMSTVIIYTAGSAVRLANLDIDQADDLVASIRKLMIQTEGKSAND